MFKIRDPMLELTLDDFNAIFKVTPLGIVRYLTLLKPVDREVKQTYTFMVRAPTCAVTFSNTVLISWEGSLDYFPLTHRVKERIEYVSLFLDYYGFLRLAMII